MYLSHLPSFVSLFTFTFIFSTFRVVPPWRAHLSHQVEDGVQAATLSPSSPFLIFSFFFTLTFIFLFFFRVVSPWHAHQSPPAEGGAQAATRSPSSLSTPCQSPPFNFLFRFYFFFTFRVNSSWRVHLSPPVEGGAQAATPSPSSPSTPCPCPPPQSLLESWRLPHLRHL